MSNMFDMRCPKCGNQHEIDIQAMLWIRLTNDGTDADESKDGNHEWDAKSPATCNACGHNGKVKDFEPDED